MEMESVPYAKKYKIISFKNHNIYKIESRQ